MRARLALTARLRPVPSSASCKAHETHAATVEDLETERAAIPVEQQKHEALMLEVRRLRRQRRELVLAAVAAGTPVRATAEAAHVTEGAVTWLVQARAAK